MKGGGNEVAGGYKSSPKLRKNTPSLLTHLPDCVRARESFNGSAGKEQSPLIIHILKSLAKPDDFMCSERLSYKTQPYPNHLLKGEGDLPKSFARNEVLGEGGRRPDEGVFHGSAGKEQSPLIIHVLKSRSKSADFFHSVLSIKIRKISIFASIIKGGGNEVAGGFNYTLEDWNLLV